MSYLKTKGIVIREKNTGEADKIITIFSESHGKISAIANSAKRPKSKLVAGTQLLCYSDFLLYRSRDMYRVNTCDVIQSFYPIRDDIIKLTYAAHLIDIIRDVIQENQSSQDLLKLFLNTLHLLAKKEKDPDLITSIFELRMLSLIGYSPGVSSCSLCGSKEIDLFFFSFSKCGFICEKCIKKGEEAKPITKATAKALMHIVFSDAKSLFSFQISKQSLEELGNLTRQYLRERLEKDYRKLDYIQKI